MDQNLWGQGPEVSAFTSPLGLSVPREVGEPQFQWTQSSQLPFPLLSPEKFSLKVFHDDPVMTALNFPV